jgi:hypothetical protein
MGQGFKHFVVTWAGVFFNCVFDGSIFRFFFWFSGLSEEKNNRFLNLTFVYIQ